MIAQILSTGDELILGDIADTNAAHLCRELKTMGISVSRISAVGDDVTLLRNEIQGISRTADICLVTGGLGPTQDDVTAKAAASAARQSLALNPAALVSMKAFFAAKGWPITRENEKQALMPETAEVLENTQGTAPGFSIQINQCTFFFMPGVPFEMKAMMKAQVMPRIQAAYDLNAGIQIRRLTLFGLSESRVARCLEGFSQEFPEITLGYRVRFPLIEVKLMVQAILDRTMDTLMDAAVTWTMGQLENRVISTQGLTLEQEVANLLSASGQTLSVAESCTGGLISHLITEVPGASGFYLFSATTYANSAKTNILNVSSQTLGAHGAVHEQTALEMAKGVRAAGGSDWGISTTGIAGPTGGSKEKPVGTVCIGVAGPDRAFSKRVVFDTGDRRKNKVWFAAAALDLLRRELIKQAGDPDLFG